MRPHRRLDVWSEAMDLVVALYEITRAFPKTEQYALADQLRRAPWNKSQLAIPWGGPQFRYQAT